MKKLFLLPFLFSSCIIDYHLTEYDQFYYLVNKSNNEVIIKLYHRGCDINENKLNANDTLKLAGYTGSKNCNGLNYVILDSADFIFSDQKKVRMKSTDEKQKWGTYNIFNRRNFSDVREEQVHELKINIWSRYQFDDGLQKLAQ